MKCFHSGYEFHYDEDGDGDDISCLGEWASAHQIRLAFYMIFDTVRDVQQQFNRRYLGITEYKNLVNLSPFAAHQYGMLMEDQDEDEEGDDEDQVAVDTAELNAQFMEYLLRVLAQLGPYLHKVNFGFFEEEQVLLTRGTADFLLLLHQRMPQLTEVNVYFQPKHPNHEIQVFPKNPEHLGLADVEMVSLEEEAAFFFTRIESARPSLEAADKQVNVYYYFRFPFDAIVEARGPVHTTMINALRMKRDVATVLKAKGLGLRREILDEMALLCSVGEEEAEERMLAPEQQTVQLPHEIDIHNAISRSLRW